MIIHYAYSTLDCQNYCINFIMPYTGLSYIITSISLCQVIMARGQPGKRKGADRGKKKQTIQYEGPSKRGRKTHKEVLENIADLYKADNSAQIRNTIHGWERESSYDDEDVKQHEATLDFPCDPTSTRGRVSLFH